MALSSLMEYGRILPVKHGVAIRTDRPKVSDRIDFVIRSNTLQWEQMVNVNKSLPGGTVSTFEMKTARGTLVAVVFDAALSGHGIPFVGVHGDGLHRPFMKLLRFRQFICVWDFTQGDRRVEPLRESADAALVSLNAGTCL